MTDPPPIPAGEAARILASIHVTPAMTRYTLTMAGASIVVELLGLAWCWIVLASGLSRWIAAKAAGRARPLFASGALYWTGYRAIRWLLFFPASWYLGYRMPHLYGLSHQGAGLWLWDNIKGWLIDTSIGAVVVGALLVFVRRWPSRWPFVFAAFASAVTAFLIFISPVLIDKAFNKFTPLPMSSPLRPGIERLAARAGIPDAQILVADKSRQTDETNAYVTGLGATRRIVLWDTLIRKMPPEQIDAVLAHEMGHYVEHHVTIGFWLTTVAFFVLLPLVRWMAEAMIAREGGRWGMATIHEPAAIPALLLSIGLIELIGSPISAAASRVIEHRADAYGLTLCQDRVSMARSFIALSRDNLSLPSPPTWLALLEDHPPLADRARFALYGKPSEEWPRPAGSR